MIESKAWKSLKPRHIGLYVILKSRYKYNPHTKECNKDEIVLTSTEAEELYDKLKDSISISLVDANTKKFKKYLIVIPAYIAKGLEFDSVIIYNDRNNSYRKNERNLLYVACTRCQHELYIYN